jgi:hypothetical protein
LLVVGGCTWPLGSSLAGAALALRFNQVVQLVEAKSDDRKKNTQFDPAAHGGLTPWRFETTPWRMLTIDREQSDARQQVWMRNQAAVFHQKLRLCFLLQHLHSLRRPGSCACCGLVALLG